ncbi:MAG: hypothetical protein KatS3mg051_0790 [Anaerolineae bacterium]|nr:MAG: hypothetical protein KatS3mg051_0790 [Anaerolineae bacterium]
MSVEVKTGTPPDERLLQESLAKKLFRRPELGAISGAILVWVLFALVAGDRGFVSLRATANFLEVASELGILAVAVALLMIGGEFDLSIGSIIGGAGMTIAILSVHYQWNLWAAIGVALLFSLAVGAINGILVVRTRLPSFIITLGSLFIIRGMTIGLTRLITGRTQVGGIKATAGYDSAALSSPAPSGSPTRRRNAGCPPSSPSRSCGGWGWPPSAPMCCCAPAPATGYLASAATPTPPAMSACPSAA